MTPEHLLLFIVAVPGATFLLLSLLWLLGADLRERTVSRITCAIFAVMTFASLWLGLSMYLGSIAAIRWDDGIWFRAGEYAFELDLVADWLAMPLIALTAMLVGLVGLSSVRYMHREPGFLRFFLLLHLFAFGSMLVFAAGSFDLFIGGWELVGISSALLVAFFHERRDPVRSSIYVFSTYRVGDLGLLLGVFVLHYMNGTAEMGNIFQGAWPIQTSTLSPTAASLTGLLFLFAAAAKSAQVPFFGWLPRAMQGPTPSSAIFYGAISVHAGAYLLLRIYPVLSVSPFASAAVIAVGLISAIVGTALHRVVADAKNSIAYAAMTQLGIIFIEIGLGFPKLALAHMLGHAIVRTLQFLRAPSVLHDYRRVHAAAGGQLGRTGAHFEHVFAEPVRLWVYRAALDRAFYDTLVIRAVVNPVLALSRWLASFEPGAAKLESRSRPFAEAEPAVQSMQGTKA